MKSKKIAYLLYLVLLLIIFILEKNLGILNFGKYIIYLIGILLILTIFTNLPLLNNYFSTPNDLREHNTKAKPMISFLECLSLLIPLILYLLIL